MGRVVTVVMVKVVMVKVVTNLKLCCVVKKFLHLSSCRFAPAAFFADFPQQASH